MSSVAQREQLELALDYVREGDTFTVTKLDRLARSVGDLLEIVARLEAKKVSLRVLSMSGAEPLDTGTGDRQADVGPSSALWVRPSGKPCWSGNARGSPEPKREGRYKGRVPTVRRQAAEIIRLKEAGVRPSEIASRLGIGRASVYRVLGDQTASEHQEAA